jgi:hypothetical protein
VRFRRIIVFTTLCLGGSVTSPAEELTSPTFTDVTAEAGINTKHSYGDVELDNIVEGTGAGAMFFDYNGDGWLDIYQLNGCWMKGVNDNRGRRWRGKLTNHLYRNNKDGTFTDVTQQAGVGDQGFGVGSSAADFDRDGDLDLYVLNYGPNVFYRNEGDGSFTDMTERSGLGNPMWSLSAPWFDYDRDGDLDVYVVNYLEYDDGKFRSFYAAAGYPGPLSYSGRPDALYRNNDDGTFTEVTKEAGLLNPNGRGMSAAIADLDNDGLLDIYVANDAMENYFYRNQGNGTFVEDGLIAGIAFGEGGQGVSSMGPVIGDFNRDRWLDIFVPDMGYGCLLVNQGADGGAVEDVYFDDHTALTRLARICGQYTGWGGVLQDFDNDGFLDVFVANGNAHHEYTEEDVLARFDGKSTFLDVARHAGSYFEQKYVGRGATFGDYDNDGDVDLLVANLNDLPRLLRNDTKNNHHWLKIDARLPGGKSPAIGARITVTTNDLVQIQDAVPVVGYLSQADPRSHFGLGKYNQADSVKIRWPDGSTTELQDVAADQILVVTQKGK